MIYGVLSDVHSNLEGLRAILDQVKRIGVDRVLFLGDAVGYGADPNACVRLLSGVSHVAIRGNHDRVVADHRANMQYSNDGVRMADFRNRELIDVECLGWVRGLPEGPVVVDGTILVCHGSPWDEDEYLMSWETMGRAVAVVRERHPAVRVCLFGHTHVAAVIEDGRTAKGRDVELAPRSIYLINPGSVGQPRDGDPRASFGVVDTGTGRYRNYRVGYDIGAAQAKIVEAGIPRVFADRLRVGRVGLGGKGETWLRGKGA